MNSDVEQMDPNVSESLVVKDWTARVMRIQIILSRSMLLHMHAPFCCPRRSSNPGTIYQLANFGSRDGSQSLWSP